MKFVLSTLAGLVILFGQARATEQVFHFSGTLAGETRCAPSDDPFCGPYVGTLTIDDEQSGMEWTQGHEYYYLYKEAKVVFANGQAVTATSPNELPPKQSALMSVTSRLGVSKDASGNLHITIHMFGSGADFGAIAPQYYYATGTFDPSDLRDILGALPGHPYLSKFSVLGGACSWGPCLDKSLTALVPEANIENQN